MNGPAWLIGFWSFFFLLGLVEHLGGQASDGAARLRRWPINIVLGWTNAVLISLLPAVLVYSALWAQQRGVGLMNWLAWPLVLTIPVTVLTRCLSQYLFHRLLHAVPFLWPIHRVHHSDDFVDGSSGLRFHPLEALANVIFVGAIALALGFDPVTLALFEAVMIIVGIIGHTSAAIPESADRAARLVIITPHLHRLHHSIVDKDANSNFGTFFSFWDRLFGTYTETRARPDQPLRFGSADTRTGHAQVFWWQLASPFYDWFPSRPNRFPVEAREQPVHPASEQQHIRPQESS